jgi:aerobic carbon-monoxide dehydrogenase large subunit
METQVVSVQKASAKIAYVGQSLKRVEDLHLLSGKDTFLDNLKFPAMTFAGFVRSPYAFARIKNIDCSALDNDPDVIGYVLPEEVMEKTEGMPVFWKPFGIKAPIHYSLAKEFVRYQGEPIVAVVVSDRAKLEDAIERVKIEYEPLQAITDPDEALNQSSRVLHPELGTGNLSYQMTFGPDVSEQLASSEFVIEHGFKIQRLAANPMEARGVFATYESGQLTLYASTQWPHLLRTHIARGLHVPENSIRVIAPDVGGGFGVKDEIYPEEFLTAFLALKFKRPTKWVETRTESFLGIAQSRDQMIKAKLGFDRDGKFTALKVDITCDLGAYLLAVGAGTPFITALSLDGPYKIPALAVDFRCVFTNKVPLSAYRGFGESEAAFVVERLMDLAAKKLKIDASEIRFRNLIQPGDFPYHTTTGGIYDSGDYPRCLSDVLKLSNYVERKERTRAEQRQSSKKRRGLGIAIYTETTGFAPSPVFGEMGLEMGGFDSANLKVDPSGKVTIATGAFPHGQGFNTTLSQIVADELGLDLADITAFHGDTSSSPYGHGSFGSRTMAVCGSAAVFACRQLKEKMSKIAAGKLGVNAASIEFSDGYLVGSDSKRVAFSEIAREAYLAHHLPQGIPPGLESTYYYDPIGFETSYAAHVCEVEVDEETGFAKIVGYWVVQDCGKMINPKIVEGQIQGAVAQAVGQALFEEVLYNQDGALVTTSFLDYLLPSAESVPEIVMTSFETPSPLTPLGVKGVGESGTIIGPPAIINAICDALNVELFETPAKPEVVLQAMDGKRKSE